jgi:signal transduction histidine kinase
VHILKTLRSSTFRLALISIALFGAVVVALLAYVYWSATSTVFSGSDQAIEGARADLQRAYDKGGVDGLVRMIRLRVAGGASADAFYLFADRSYKPIAGNLTSWPSAMRGAQSGSEITTEVTNPNLPTNQFLLLAEIETLADGSHLLVGENIDALALFKRKMKGALGITLAFIFGLAAVASVSVTRRTVGRIETVNATSRAILEGGLGTRIPLRGTQDEWDQLAENLNSMLDRIEALMREVKQVTDNVAHDLRTPLSRMRGRLESASEKLREGDSDQLLIDNTLADLDGVLRMFSSLMRISQIEAVDPSAAFDAVNLTEVVNEVVELFDAAAEERGSRVNVIGDQCVFISGDRDLLFDAVANLVDNAIKYGREGGQVKVAVAKDDESAMLAVADDGPGIAPAEVSNVFRRFYRLEQSRGAPGHGLGLSLVAAVTRIHGARVEMLDKAPGLEVQIRFPLHTVAGAKQQTHQRAGIAVPPISY